MKNKFFLGLATGCVFLGMSGNAIASIITYTFQGTVNSITRDAHIVDGLTAIGDNVEFSFNVDLDATGFQTRYNGQFIERTDHDNDLETVDYFWTDYIGGTDIGPIGVISDPNPNWFNEFNYGLSVNRKENGAVVQDTGYLYGGSSYNWVSIENYSQNVQDWEVGNGSFQFRHQVANQAGEYAWIRGHINLTDMPAQVPEPNTILLFALGLAGIVGTGMKFNKNKNAVRI